VCLSSNNIEDGIVSNNIISSAYKYNMYTWEIFYALGSSDIFIYIYIVLDRTKVWGAHTIKLYVIGLGDDIKFIWHAQYFHCESSVEWGAKNFNISSNFSVFILFAIWCDIVKNIYSLLCMLCFNSFIILYASPIACMYVQSNREYKFSLIEGEILLSMVMVKKQPNYNSVSQWLIEAHKKYIILQFQVTAS